MNAYPTKDLFREKRKLPIIDIRTEQEWIQTGILEKSHTITFFDEMGNYNIESFLAELHGIIGKGKDNEFMLICRTGSRTGQIANYLAQSGYKPINLAGGIHYVLAQKSYEIVPYKK
ncbi:Rhodanese-related sulfurtransferase [Thiovulum sp. ES]|nr:Rhodanese-related sulfurtransferase [Thiovulum sp. ES]